MHELSIAQNIVEIIHARVREDELANVRSVKLRVGTFSGVVPHSLKFCYEALIADTGLNHSRIDIETVSFVIKCSDCSKQSNVDNGFALCPSCGSRKTMIVSGNELDIVEIILQENQAEHA
ncbi:MAG: hydrogenase maturation nickel metallochaperone HypA [Bacteroidota bacterium]